MSSGIVRLHVYSTSSTSAIPHRSKTSTRSNSSSSSSNDLSQNEKIQLPEIPAAVAKVESDNVDIEKQSELIKIATQPPLTIQAGRPDVRKIIQDAIGSCAKNERLIVAACGPDSIMAVTRQTVVDNIKSDGPSIELHCEQFGW